MATRVTSNRQIENLDNNQKRVERTNAPAIETENARHGVLPMARRVNVAANLAGVALAMGGSVDADAPTFIRAARAGRVVGLTFDWYPAGVSAGAVTVRIGVNGTATGPTTSLAAAAGGVVDLASEVAFAEGDKVSVLITTDGSFSPTTNELMIQPVIRWDA